MGLSLGEPRLTWEEIWEKYEGQIVQEEYRKALTNERYNRLYPTGKLTKPLLNEEEVTMQIYFRILERSCATNEAFDKMFLKEDGEDNNLAAMVAQLESDVAGLLRPKEYSKAMKIMEKKKHKIAKAEIKKAKAERKAKEREEKAQRKAKEREEKAQRKAM